jgi:hypothetical protein
MYRRSRRLDRVRDDERYRREFDAPEPLHNVGPKLTWNFWDGGAAGTPLVEDARYQQPRSTPGHGAAGDAEVNADRWRR